MQTFVYMVLGCASSDRRQVLHDLIKDIAKEDDPFQLWVQTGEAPSEWDAKLAELEHLKVETYPGGVDSITPGQLDLDATPIILTPGKDNPVDQVEALKPLLESSGCELGRIITIAHCGLLEKHPQLNTWYDACMHFSDVCLINRAPETTNQFLQDFIDRYKENHFPCLLETTSKGRVKNPDLILEPQARRISLYFEPDQDRWLDDEEEDDAWEEPSVDPYLVKLPSGLREKRIPDIASFL